MDIALIDGEATLIRVAKIAAVMYIEPDWIALLDGGHVVKITEEEYEEFIVTIENANASDGNFFARGG